MHRPGPHLGCRGVAAEDRPRVAQNSESLKISCCSVTRSIDYTGVRGPSSGRASGAGGRTRADLSSFLQVQVQQAAVGDFELAGGGGVERRSDERIGASTRRCPKKMHGCQRQLRPASGRTTAADVVVVARGHDGAAVVGAAAFRTRRQLGIDALEPQQPELEIPRQRASGGRAVSERVDHRRAEAIETLVGVPFRRPLVDQLGEVRRVPERGGVVGAARDDRQRAALRLDVVDADEIAQLALVVRATLARVSGSSAPTKRERALRRAPFATPRFLPRSFVRNTTIRSRLSASL